jgi:hypothetical protein
VTLRSDGRTSGSEAGASTTQPPPGRSTPTGAYWSQHPFREPEPGYLGRVFAEERSARCEFGTPIVDGDRESVEWTGQTELVDGGEEDLVGVSLLRFDGDGLVVEQRDIWVGR